MVARSADAGGIGNGRLVLAVIVGEEETKGSGLVWLVDI